MTIPLLLLRLVSLSADFRAAPQQLSITGPDLRYAMHKHDKGSLATPEMKRPIVCFELCASGSGSRYSLKRYYIRSHIHSKLQVATADH